MKQKLNEIENKLLSQAADQVERISLFPYMELFYISATSNVIKINHPEWKYILEINYCKSGRIDWEMGNDNQIYLGPGDFLLHTLDSCADSTIQFPTGSYEGLTLCINLKELKKHPPELLADAQANIDLIYEKFCKNGTFSSFAGTHQTDSIFTGFYEQDTNLRLSYQKLKSLELLLYLMNMKTNKEEQLTEYRSELVEIVHSIHMQLTKNIGKRLTIEELSAQYAVNPTTLKKVFKSVYGKSIAAHINEHRMEMAARLLRETDIGIAEIGQKVGYESQSKFSAAFKSHFEILPREYRKTAKNFTPKSGCSKM